MDLFSYILTFIEGILTFISPCILPMLPIYFLYLAGTSNEDSVEVPLERKKLITNSIGFVVGFTIVFVLLGATVTSFGYFLVSHKDLLRKISGIIIILFGLNFIGILKLKFLNFNKRLDIKFNKLGFFSSILFGFVFGFGWTPCLGAFLGSALVLASNSKTVLQGITLLLVYSAGLGIPFIVAAIIFDQFKVAFRLIQKNIKLISIISGVLLILAGILVFTDSLKYFTV